MPLLSVREYARKALTPDKRVLADPKQGSKHERADPTRHEGPASSGSRAPGITSGACR